MVRSSGVKRTKAADLFEHVEEEDEDDDLDPEEGVSQLKVNHEFAKRFEHNKRRTELHRLEAKHPELSARIKARALLEHDDNEDDEDSSSEEDDGEIPAAEEKRWVEALLKIRNKDPSIYDTNTKLFDEDDDADSSAGDDSEGGSTDEDEDDDDASSGEDTPPIKSKTLRQVLYEQAVDEHDADAAGEDTDLDRKKRLRQERAENFAYDAEQKQLRTSLLSKLHGDEDVDEGDEDGLVVKSKPEKTPSNDAWTGVEHDLDAYFTTRASTGHSAPDEGDKFLRKFLTKRLWEEEGDDAGDSTGHLLGNADAPVDSSEEEEFVDNADDFERSYNFRSEEPAGAAIATYPREIEGTARRQEGRRKRQREAKLEREAARKSERADELKRLKNLKRKEVKDAMDTLAAVSGKAAPDKHLLQQLLDADFDPSAWDKAMASAFDDSYYAETEREADVRADEAELARELAQWSGAHRDEEDVGGPAGDTFAAIHKRITGTASVHLPENDYDAEAPGRAGAMVDADDADVAGTSGRDEDDDSDDADRERQASHALAESRSKIHDLLQEYNKLDYEDDIGGLKTRFKYRRVEPINDGLSEAEILALADNELNTIIGLKKYAPYQEDSKRVRPNYKALSAAKQKLKDLGLYYDRRKGDGSAGSNARAKQARAAGVSHEAGAADIAPGQKRKRSHSASDAKADHSNKGERQGRKAGKTSAGQAADSGAQKKKRPGPALRRALKAEAEAQAASAGAGAKDTGGAGAKAEDSGATRTVPQKGTPDRGNSAARVHGRPAPKTVLSERDQKKRRLASYGKLSMPGRSTGQDEAPEAKAHKPRDAKKGAQSTAAAAATSALPSDLTKAAKKNLKRAMKRRAAKAGSVPAV